MEFPEKNASVVDRARLGMYKWLNAESYFKLKDQKLRKYNNF